MRLHINIDHVATLRNQRDTPYPSVVEAARLCLAAGADGLTLHLREDRRHIRDQDVFDVRAMPHSILNLEMAATSEMAEIARQVRPDAVTLVPERREERTTEGGLNVVAAADAISKVLGVCDEVGAKLSLFIEPSLVQVRAAKACGARQVEFHTGHYCEAAEAQRAAQLAEFRAACELAHELGLEVAAGHGLTTENVAPICGLPHMAELNIGHSVVSEALFLGLEGAVTKLRSTIDEAIKQAAEQIAAKPS